MIDRITYFLSFTNGVPVVGNLTVLYTLLSTKHGLQNYFDRPAIETTLGFQSTNCFYSLIDSSFCINTLMSLYKVYLQLSERFHNKLKNNKSI